MENRDEGRLHYYILAFQVAPPEVRKAIIQARSDEAAAALAEKYVAGQRIGGMGTVISVTPYPA
jgi:hypothetical protein